MTTIPTPPPVAPPASPPPQAGARKSSALAVGALILGLCGIVPILGILLGGIGIVLGIVVLAKNAGGKGLAVGGIIAGLVGIVIGQALMVVIMLVPALSRARELSKRALCGGNLNGIGKGIAMYATENNDAYPPNLQVLITEGSVSARMLQCPSAGGNRRCDYFYFPPPGDPAEDPAEDSPYVWRDMELLVACDFKNNHGGEGRNVMYASMLTKWILEDAFQAELAKPVNAAFAAALRKAEGP